MTNPWQLYDDLIDGLPSGITVREVACSHWACVVTDAGAGVSMAYHGGPSDADRLMNAWGTDLRDVASLVKSWDMSAASVGVAALNSWYNTQERLSAWRVEQQPRHKSSTFDIRREDIIGHKVGMIGHFPEARWMAELCDLKVFERSERNGDYPDMAAEYELADRDWIFITGSTLANRTLPRLLALGRHARITLVGPTTCFAPEVFRGSVAEFGGSIVVDGVQVLKACRTSSRHDQCRPGLRPYNIALPSLDRDPLRELCHTAKEQR